MNNNYSIRFSQKALLQYRKAAAWYSDKSLVAEDNFIASVEDRIRMLREDLHRYRNMYKQFYEVAMKKYPYLLIYLINEKQHQVLIFSVHHHKQNRKENTGGNLPMKH